MVRRSILMAAVLGLATTLSGAAVAQPAQPKAPAAQQKETCEFQVRTRSKVGYRGFATYYVKGPWIREEKRTGGGMELILVNNEKGLFIRNKHNDYWFKYPEGMGNSLRRRILGGPIGEVRKFLKSVRAINIGKEKVEGALCNVWTYRFTGADDRFRLWTDLQNTRPIRMERDYKVPSTQKRDVLVIEYKRYMAGQTLSDSLFQIEGKHKVHDMTSIFNRLAKKKIARDAKQSGRASTATPTTGTPAPSPAVNP